MIPGGGMRMGKEEVMYRFILFITVSFLTSTVFAETVTLKSGRIIAGDIVEQTNDYIRIKADGEVLKIPLKYIAPEGELLKNITQEGNLNLDQKTSNRSLPLEEKLVKYLRSGNFEEMARFLEEEKKQNPNDAIIYLRLGQAYQHLKNYDDAISNFEQANKLFPDNFEIYLSLFNVYESSGQTLEAKKYFNQVEQLRPGDPAIYIVASIVYMDAGKIKEAREAVLKAKELYARAGDTQNVAKCDSLLTNLSGQEEKKGSAP